MRKSTYLSIVLLVLLLLTVGCKGQENLPEENLLEPVSFKVVTGGGPSAVGMAKMFEDTTSLDENTTLEYAVAKGPDLLSASVLSGEGDFVMMASNLAAKMYNEGVDYKVGAVTTWGVMYLVTNGEEVNSFQDLIGKEVATMGKGASADVQFRYLLEKNGIDPDNDLNIVYRSGHEEATSFIVAQKDKISVLPEPWVSVAQSKSSDIKIAIDLQEEWKKSQKSEMAAPQGVLMIKNETIEKHPEYVEKFLEEYSLSIQWVNSNPEQAGEIIEKHNLGVPKVAAANAIPRCNIIYKTPIESMEYIEDYFALLLDFNPKMIGGKIPDEGFYYNKK